MDIPRYVALANRGIIVYETLHTDTFKLDEINDAFDLLKSGNAGRIIIKMEDSITECLDILDKRYYNISEIANMPLFYYSPQIKKVVNDLDLINYY